MVSGNVLALEYVKTTWKRTIENKAKTLEKIWAEVKLLQKTVLLHVM